MKKLLLATLTTLTLILTACGSAQTPQTGPANQDRTLPLATQLIVGTFKLDGTAQAITAEQAKELLPMWQVYKGLLSSDTAAQEEKDGLVDQIKETMTSDQIQAITSMNLTQRDVFTLMQEKGLGFSGGQRNNSNGSNSTSNGTSTRGNGGFAPPDGGFPGGGFPGGGPDGGFSGNQSRSSSNGNSQNGTSTTTARPQFNAATTLLEPLIELLKQKAGS